MTMSSLFVVAISVIAIFLVSNTHALPTCLGPGLCRNNGRTVQCFDLGYQCCSRGFNENKIFTLVSLINDHKCCEGSGGLYDVRTEVCDHGVVVSKFKINATGMCGVYSPINSDLQECCMKDHDYGVVYDKIPGAECCNESYLTHLDEKCCSGHVYQPSQKVCCSTLDDEDRLYDIPGGKCCLEVPYDPVHQRCVSHTVKSKSEEEQDICNGIPYNLEERICCNGILISRARQICHRLRTVVNKSSSTDNAACRVADSKYVTYYSPPSGKTVCIEGERVYSLQGNESLCGNTVIDDTKDLCCSETPHPNSIREHKQCCKNEAYNPAMMTCCPNNRVNYDIAENDGGKCCGIEAFDSRTHYCSNRKEIVESDCADRSKPPLYKRCEITAEKIEALKEYFRQQPMSVFVVNVKEKTTTKVEKWKTPIKTKVDTITWKLNSAKQIQVMGKKKQMRLNFADLTAKKLKTIKAKKCSCPEEIRPNEDYLVFTANPIKRKSLILLPMEDFSDRTHDLVITLEDARRLSLLETLLAL